MDIQFAARLGPICYKTVGKGSCLNNKFADLKVQFENFLMCYLQKHEEMGIVGFRGWRAMVNPSNNLQWLSTRSTVSLFSIGLK